jgi:acetolactate synthase-1/2/3 large subunit
MHGLSHWSTPPETGPGDVQMGPIMNYLEAGAAKDDAIFTNGAGNYATWLHRFHRSRRFQHAGSADIGFDGLRPAGCRCRQTAIPRARSHLLCRRRLLHDARTGICDRRALQSADHHAGDQQRHLRHDPHASGAGISRPGQRYRSHQSRLRSALPAPMADMARLVEKTAEFAGAFERARQSGKPSIIEIRLDPEAITPTRTLSQIRNG